MSRVAEGAIDEDAILDALRSHRGGSGRASAATRRGAAFGDRWRTLATVIVEPAARRMTLRRNGPCGTAAAAAPLQRRVTA